MSNPPFCNWDGEVRISSGTKVLTSVNGG
jgi:hypothetical protein